MALTKTERDKYLKSLKKKTDTELVVAIRKELAALLAVLDREEAMRHREIVTYCEMELARRRHGEE